MSSSQSNSLERQIAAALRAQIPVRNLPGVMIENVEEKSEPPFDITFDLRSDRNRIQVLSEAKQNFSPRVIAEIAPWIRRLKSLRPDLAVALVSPVFSEQAQQFCIENRIDFLDLSGNISINVPGKFTLRRTGMRARTTSTSKSESALTTSNVFSGRYSRVLRVLLENPRQWTVTEIGRELERESKRFSNVFPSATEPNFMISLGAISKAISGLEEQLSVRRRGTAVIIPEPRRVLTQWAEKYKERYRWRLRSSFQTENPFGTDLASINRGLEELGSGTYAFTGAAAASKEAPFVDIDLVDVFLLPAKSTVSVRKLGPPKSSKPLLRFITPYDVGVFMYARKVERVPAVSIIQAYLDLYARGGRDLKQAEHLLANVIEPRWRTL
jgi:hypothetical protein